MQSFAAIVASIKWQYCLAVALLWAVAAAAVGRFLAFIGNALPLFGTIGGRGCIELSYMHF